MKPNKYDKYVFLICVIIFVYSFFVIGYEPVTRADKIRMVFEKGDLPSMRLLTGDPRRVVSVNYPSSVIIAPLVALIYLCFMVFERELYPVDRCWAGKKISGFKNKFLYKIKNP